MNIINLQIIVILSTLYFLIRNKIDIYLLFFLSNVIYGSHIIANFIWIPPFSAAVHPNARLILSTVILAIVSIALIKDIALKQSSNYRFTYFENDRYNFIKEITFCYTIIFTLVIIFYAVISGSIHKSTLNKLGFLVLFFQYFSVATLIYIWTIKSSTFIKIIGTLPIIILFLTDARVFAVVGIIGVLIVRFYNQKIFSSKNLIKITGIIFIVLAGAYLPRFGSVIIEEKNKELLTPYLYLMIGSYEFGQISYNLNAATDPNYDSKHTIKALLFGSIPLLHRLDNNAKPRRFHYYLKKNLNPGFDYGLGGTFWGESYVLGGIFGVILNLLLISILIEWLEKKIFTGKIFYPLYLLTLIYITFLPRYEIFMIIAVLKNLFYFILFYSISLKLIPRKRKLLYS